MTVSHVRIEDMAAIHLLNMCCWFSIALSMLLRLFHAPHKELLGKDFFVKLLSHPKTWTQDKTHPSQKGERRTLASRNILILLGLSHVPLTAQQVLALDLFAKSPFDISGVVFFLYQTMTISSILFKNNQRNTNLIFKVPIAGEYVTQMTHSH